MLAGGLAYGRVMIETKAGVCRQSPMTNRCGGRPAGNMQETHQTAAAVENDQMESMNERSMRSKNCRCSVLVVYAAPSGDSPGGEWPRVTLCIEEKVIVIQDMVFWLS